MSCVGPFSCSREVEKPASFSFQALFIFIFSTLPRAPFLGSRSALHLLSPKFILQLWVNLAGIPRLSIGLLSNRACTPSPALGGKVGRGLGRGFGGRGLGVHDLIAPTPHPRCCGDPDTDCPQTHREAPSPPREDPGLTSREGGNEVMKEGKAPARGDWVGAPQLRQGDLRACRWRRGRSS